MIRKIFKTVFIVVLCSATSCFACGGDNGKLTKFTITRDDGTEQEVIIPPISRVEEYENDGEVTVYDFENKDESGKPTVTKHNSNS